MLKSLAEESWLTENVEVRTVDGWVSIYNLTMEEDLLVYDHLNEKYRRSPIRQFSTGEYDGVVHEYVSKLDADTRVFAKNLLPLIDMVIKSQLKYEGKIYSIEPNFGMMIIRGFTSYHGNNQDYIIII